MDCRSEAGHDRAVAAELRGSARWPVWGRLGVGDSYCRGEHRRRVGAEVPGNDAVVKGQPGRSVRQGDGVECEASGDDARLELGGPVATATERVEQRVEGRR